MRFHPAFCNPQFLTISQLTGGDVTEALNLIFQGGDLSEQASQQLQPQGPAPDFVDPGYGGGYPNEQSIPIESGLINDKLPPPTYQDENPPPVPPRQNRPVHIEDIQYQSQSPVSTSDSSYLKEHENYRYQYQTQQPKHTPEPEYSIYDDPTKYQRPEDVPPLLMPVRNGVLESYLNPFLTILHEIPAFRKAIYHHQFETLGFHPRWYKGELVNVPDGTTIKVKDGETHDLRFLLEVQRIFGFLDGDSQRFFSSINNFIRSFPNFAKKEFAAIDNIYDAYSVFYKVLCSQLGTTGVENSLSFFESKLEDGTTENREFGMFHVEAEELKGDLYSTLHNILWGDDLENQQVLSQLSDVMTMSFEPSYDESIISKGVIISETFYPQIYTSEFEEEITQLLKERHEIDLERRKISKELMNLRAYNGKHVSAILSTSIEFIASELEDSAEDVKLAAALEDLRSIKVNNNEKVIDLTEQQNLLLDKKAEINPYDVNVILERHGKVPEPYLLIGAIVSNNEFYFLRKLQEDLIDMGENNEQWVRIVYEPKSGNDLRCSVSDFEDVARVVHATTQGQYETSMVLIYVKESTWKTQVEYEVPQAVQNFISKDRLELERSLEVLASSTDGEISEDDADVDEDNALHVIKKSEERQDEQGGVSLKSSDDDIDEDKENSVPSE